MRAAIYGAGSLGTILGAFISKAGGKIELINRNKAHVEALKKSGAKVTGTLNFTQKFWLHFSLILVFLFTAFIYLFIYLFAAPEACGSSRSRD